MSNDHILLMDYNPEWPKMAKDEIAHLRHILPADLIIDIQHVGSTAIPGMIAKPIIDLQIAVMSLVQAKETMIKPMEADHYAYWYDNPDLERMFFVKGLPPQGKGRTHHVHIVEKHCHHWEEKIKFRDYLITHPSVAAEYATIKRDLAKMHFEDREMYTEAKSTFIKGVLALPSSPVIIRPFDAVNDMDRVIDIWYQGSLLAHSFIDPQYWFDAKSLMETVYIPNAITWVLMDDDIIVGFYSTVEDRLAAIFIDPSVQGRGYGKMMLHHAFERNRTLQLHVYQKNKVAVHFYLKYGFKIESECIDDNTGEVEYVMRWSCSKSMHMD